MIERTKQVWILNRPMSVCRALIKKLQEVEAQYSKANGREHDAVVIYGDTDSVMVKFGPTDLEAVMALGMTALFRLRTGLMIIFRSGGGRPCHSEVC
jgi:hypothetical protein